VYGVKLEKTGIYELDDIGESFSENFIGHNSRNTILNMMSMFMFNLEPNSNNVLYKGSPLFDLKEFYDTTRKNYNKKFGRKMAYRSWVITFSLLAMRNLLKIIKYKGNLVQIYINPRYLFHGDFISDILIKMFLEKHWFDRRIIPNTEII
jgi:hypothetical protein